MKKNRMKIPDIFRTEVNVEPSKYKINHKTPVMFLGSCFADNIGAMLTEKKFPVYINPFGVIYNPMSVKQSLDILINKKEFQKDDLYQFNNQWISLYHHSEFSSPVLRDALKKINSGIDKGTDFLKSTKFLFITFGTAWVYEWKETGKVVSNCHKIPAGKFNRRMLKPEEILEVWGGLIEKLKTQLPELKIIFTVSPVRHWKDSAEGNMVSKSVLLYSIRLLREKFPDTDYFPSYEIMMDDLRDYRFYGEDMLHLNTTAVNYIWQKFDQRFINDETHELLKKVDEINRAVAHKPFHPGSEDHLIFVEKTLQKIRLLESAFPEIDFSKEKQQLQAAPA